MSILKDGKRYLVQLHLEIVGGCQLRCVGCPNSTINPKAQPMALDTLEQCLRNLDVDVVQNFRLFNYGEPLLHPDLPGLGEAIHRHAAFEIRNLELSTNAQSVDWERFETFLRQGRLTTLAVSCDGDGTPENYEQLRPPAKWSRLVAFLERAARIRDRYRPDLVIITRTIITDPAHKDAWNALLAPLGITPGFRQWKYLPQSTSNMTGRAIQTGQGVCFFVAERQRLFINHAGRVVPCCVHPAAGDFGDLTRHKHADILDGPARADFIRRLKSRRPEMSVCGLCEYGPPEARGPSAG